MPTISLIRSFFRLFVVAGACIFAVAATNAVCSLLHIYGLLVLLIFCAELVILVFRATTWLYRYLTPFQAWVRYALCAHRMLSRAWIVEADAILYPVGRWSIHQASIPYLEDGEKFGTGTAYATAFSDLLRLARAIRDGGCRYIRSLRIPLTLVPHLDVALYGGRIIHGDRTTFLRRILPLELNARARYFGKASARVSSSKAAKRSLVLTRPEIVAAIPLLEEAAEKLSRRYRPLSGRWPALHATACVTHAPVNQAGSS